MIWKKITEFNGFYEVSNTGLVRSLARKIRFLDRTRVSKIKILKPNTDKNGYKTVTLQKNGFKKTVKVHRLVMEYFVGKSDLQVNHKDLNKTNNNLLNLEYVSNLENMRHVRNLKKFNMPKGKDHYAYRITDKNRKEIIRRRKKGESVASIAKDFKIHPHTCYKFKLTD